MPYFSEDDVREMQRREREDDERAYASKQRREMSFTVTDLGLPETGVVYRHCLVDGMLIDNDDETWDCHVSNMHGITSYRGYKLNPDPAGNVEIWHAGDQVDTADSLSAAHATIDEWLRAR